MKIIENIVRNKIKCTALFWTNFYLKSYLWYTSWASNIESKFQKSKVCVILYCFLQQGHVHVRHVNDNNYLTDNNILDSDHDVCSGCRTIRLHFQMVY